MKDKEVLKVAGICLAILIVSMVCWLLDKMDLRNIIPIITILAFNMLMRYIDKNWNTIFNSYMVELDGQIIDTRSELEMNVPETYKDLEALLRHTKSLKTLNVKTTDRSGQWLQRLPESLETLIINGLEAPLEKWWPREGLPSLHRLDLRSCKEVTEMTMKYLPYMAPYLKKLIIEGPDGSEMKFNLYGPLVTIRHATDSSLALLTGLADHLEKLYIEESPLVTASGLLHVSRLTKLENLTLLGVSAGSITDAVLDGLISCSGLWGLQLGDKDQPPQETAITAAAVSRLAVACRELRWLLLHTTADSSRAVLDGLHWADLGSRSNGRPRTIYLKVPEPVFSQLRRPPSGSLIELREWLS